MKLQLRSLRAINCGPLRDVCVHFNTEGEHPVTVLAGANGSGKTTALELIFSLAETLHPLYGTPGFTIHGSSIWERAEYAEIELLIDGEALSVFCGRRPSDAPLTGNSFSRLSLEQSPSPNYPLVWQKGPIAQKITELMRGLEKAILLISDEEPADDPLLLPSILYLPHHRFIGPVEAKQIQREDTEYCWTYRYNNVPSFEGSLDSYLIWLEYAEPEVFERVVKILNDLNFDGKTFSVRRKELKAIVTTKDGNTHYLEDLSSGEQNILIMLLELRRRLLPGSIVLIDEIENSLHPAFQYRIAEGLKRLQEMVPFQLIVTTHSPTFIEIFGTASTRILTEF